MNLNRGLKEHRRILIKFWSPKIQTESHGDKTKVSAGLVPSEPSWGEAVPWVLQFLLAYITTISSVVTDPSTPLGRSPLCLLETCDDILVPPRESLHPKILNIISPTKSFTRSCPLQPHCIFVQNCSFFFGITVGASQPLFSPSKASGRSFSRRQI